MMMKKRTWAVMVAVLVLLCGLVAGGALAKASPVLRADGISYASQPDEAALYLNDIVFVRDTVTLPAGQVRVLLPPGTYPDTLILTENDSRVHSYRITAQAAEVYYSQAAFRYGAASSVMAGGAAFILTWDSPDPDAEMRTVKLEYMMAGASWMPTYDMRIVDESTVELAFFAKVTNTSLVLDDTTVFLVAGRVDLSQQMDHVSQVTMNQYAVGYADTTIELPALGVGAVELQHIYPLGTLSAEPGDTVYSNLVDDTLSTRRLLVWNASAEPEVDVIYKVANSADIPLAEGIVRVFQDNLFMGSDFIETTPTGSEGSVTVGSLPDVRVRRTASEEYHGEANDYYLHSVALEINNFSGNEIALTVLDRWEENAWQFEYSMMPERQPDNLLRWEVSIPAGESLMITYQYRTEY